MCRQLQRQAAGYSAPEPFANHGHRARASKLVFTGANGIISKLLLDNCRLLLGSSRFAFTLSQCKLEGYQAQKKISRPQALRRKETNSWIISGLKCKLDHGLMAEEPC